MTSSRYRWVIVAAGGLLVTPWAARLTRLTLVDDVGRGAGEKAQPLRR